MLVPGRVDKKDRTPIRRIGETDVAAESLNDLLDDTQAETTTTFLPRISRVGLSEFFKYAAFEILRNFGALVPDGYSDSVVAIGDRDLHDRFRRRKLDDEPDIREVVALSLGLDPAFVTQSCGFGTDALVAAADWLPDVILLDVMMPVMDSPATLVRLRENPKTAGIPVIFMTARAKTRELDRLRSLGAVGIVAKPFDPMRLAASVRSYLQPVDDPLEGMRAGFLLRVKKDVAALAVLRAARSDSGDAAGKLAAIRHIAHGVAGAGGIFGFAEISDAAAELEDAVIAEMASPEPGDSLDDALDHLISRAEHNSAPPVKALRIPQDA